MEKYLYINGQEKLRFLVTVVLGNIEIIAKVNGVSCDIEKVDFYINEEYKFSDTEEPYIWNWEGGPYLKNIIETVAYYDGGKNLEDQIVIWKFF